MLICFSPTSSVSYQSKFKKLKDNIIGIMGQEHDEKNDKATHRHYIQLPKAVQSEVSSFWCEDQAANPVQYPGIFVLEGYIFVHFGYQAKGKGKRNRIKASVNHYMPPPLHGAYVRGVPP